MTQSKRFRVVTAPGVRFAVPGPPSRTSDIEAARDLLNRTQLTRRESLAGPSCTSSPALGAGS